MTRPRVDLKVTVTRARLEAYRAAEAAHGLPTPSELLDAALATRLDLAGLPVPPAPTEDPRTAAATRARVQRRRDLLSEAPRAGPKKNRNATTKKG